MYCCQRAVCVLLSESPLLQGFLLSVLGKWEDLLHDNTAIVRGVALGTGVWGWSVGRRGSGGGVSGGGGLGMECREEGVWGWCSVSAMLAVLLAPHLWQPL